MNEHRRASNGHVDAESLDPICKQVLADGFAIVPPRPMPLPELRAECDALLATERAGARRALDRSPALRRFVSDAAIDDLATAILGRSAFVARSIIFDKNPDANWDVPWHQDTTIAVRERFEVSGFGPWSTKAGVPHVRPPASVLARMITVRLHLDDCPADNGALWVVPGSHHDFVPDSKIDKDRCDESAIACECPAGAMMLMRPLLLHASRKSSHPSHRRVLHLEFASDPLPGGLEWAKL